MQGNGGADALYLEFVDGPLHDLDGIPAGAPMRDDLGNQGIIIRFNGQSGIKAAVKTYPRAARLVPARDGPRGGEKSIVWVFGVDVHSMA